MRPQTRSQVWWPPALSSRRLRFEESGFSPFSGCVTPVLQLSAHRRGERRSRGAGGIVKEMNPDAPPLGRGSHGEHWAMHSARDPKRPSLGTPLYTPGAHLGPRLGAPRSTSEGPAEP